MKKNLKLMVALTTMTCMLNAGSALIPVSAEETTKIVVIGDSISTGAGLADGQKSYVDLIQDYTNAEIQNFAQDTYTTGDVLTCLDDAQVQQALSQADVILVTVGIHDIMDKFMETTNGFMTQFGFEKFTDVFTASLGEHGFSDEMELVPYANTMADDIKLNRESATANFQEITAKLSQYQDAKIVYQTVYNLLDNIEMYDSLSMKRKMAYNSILNPAGMVVNSCFNEYLTTFTQGQDNCILIDTYSEFQGNAYKYTNLYDLEVNPNAEGHAWIAETVIAEAGLSEGILLGDADGSGKVDAADAAVVLEHAASVGAGQGDVLNEEQQKAADVDESGAVNAEDASQILMYAAAEGAGQTYEFVKAGNTEIIDADPTAPAFS